MTEFINFGDDSSKKIPAEEIIRKLRAKINAGEDSLKPQLAQMIVQAAYLAAMEHQFSKALHLIDDASTIFEQVIDSGEIEYMPSLGHCFLFRATVLRMYQGPEAGLKAINKTIRFFAERTDSDNSYFQNELAVALMSKAEWLTSPFGAFSAASAAQDQAAKIWQHLVNRGNTEFRQQLISTLILCGDSKIQSGDTPKAVEHFLDAVSVSQNGLECGDESFNPYLIQAQIKLSRLYEQIGDISSAFELTRETIQKIQSLVDDGTIQAKPMLTTLYLQHGMLFGRLGNHQSALEELNRCNDIYLEIFHDSNLHFLGKYDLHTGFANVCMCRGNVLAEMKRFDKAAQAFDEAIRQYQLADQFRPEEKDDETLTPYSIGIVQLNYANSLITQGKLDEAIAIKEQALVALRKRMDAGHDEILPNLVSAYRKMIRIFQMKNNFEEMFFWINKLIEVLIIALDEGKLEHQSDLASAYHSRATAFEERNLLAEAEKDNIKAAKLYREVADAENWSTETHAAKFMWGEMLEHIAILRTQQGNVGDAVTLFQNAIDDVTGLMNEGNKSVYFDVLLAQTQFVNFVELIIRSSNFSKNVLQEMLPEKILSRLKKLANIDPNSKHLPSGVTQYSPEECFSWIQKAIAACDVGIQTCQRHLVDMEESTTELFFLMKIAYFHRMRGSLSFLSSDHQKAYDDSKKAVKQLESLLELLSRLKLRNPSWKGDLPDLELSPDRCTDTPYEKRYVIYTDELKQTLQLWANVCLELGRYKEAEDIFEREVAQTREWVQLAVPNADRFLILSLSNYAIKWAKMEGGSDPDKITALFEETRQLLHKRVLSDDVIDKDYTMFRQIHFTLTTYWAENDCIENAEKIMEEYASDMAACRNFPNAMLWLELCCSLDILRKWITDPLKICAIRLRERELISRHPEFHLNPKLQAYAKKLKD